MQGQLEELQHPFAFQVFLDQLEGKKWVVFFSKRPFSRPETVLKYLARYTHRVATSNNRFLRMEGEDVGFRFKDYRRDGRWHTQQVHATEFIRRSLLHVLPFRFLRIRYFGLLANRHRQRSLEQCRKLLGIESSPEPAITGESVEERYQRLTGTDPGLCPSCKQGRLVLRAEIPRPIYSALRAGPRPAAMLLSQSSDQPRGPP